MVSRGVGIDQLLYPAPLVFPKFKKADSSTTLGGGISSEMAVKVNDYS